MLGLVIRLDPFRRQYAPSLAPEEEFLATIATNDWGECHNMRGEIITKHTAPAHLLFEEIMYGSVPCRITTIGIGDGGNEIGMGKVLWHDLKQRIPRDRGGIIACRTPTNYTVVCGVSNWGAYGLAAGVVWWRHAMFMEMWDSAAEYHTLATIVSDGPAVDGITRSQNPTVDGIAFEDYIRVFKRVRDQALGYS